MLRVSKVGERLGRFELLSEIGRGSHGVVFEALDTLLKEKVAIKTLHSSDATLRERFKRELILTRRVAHPGVCRLHDLHEQDDLFFISMQLVEGRSLLRVLKDETPPLLRVLGLLRSICVALQAAHDQGVVHRDLKPANIMVDAKDSVVILDFGIATAAGVNQLTRPGQAVGSVPFIAPEVWDGETASAKSDQYAVGVIGFLAATRTLPFRGVNAIEVVDAVRGTAPTLRDRKPDIDAGFETVILKAMARTPAARFDNVKMLDEALESLQTGRWSPDATPPTVMSSPAPATLGGELHLSSLLEAELAGPRVGPKADEGPVTIDTGVVALPASLTSEVPIPRTRTTAEGPWQAGGSEAVGSPPLLSSSAAPAPALALGDEALLRPPKAKDVEKTLLIRLPRSLADAAVRNEPVRASSALQGRGLRSLLAAGVVVVCLGVAYWPAQKGAMVDPAVFVADAFERVAPVLDAGAPPAAADVGVAVGVVDPSTPLDPPNPQTPDPIEANEPRLRPAVIVTGALKALRADALRQGFRTGDIREFDQAMSAGQRAAKNSDQARFDAAVGSARVALSSATIDKQFVSQKLGRYNVAYAAAPFTTQEKMRPVNLDVMDRFARGDWVGANSVMNGGFALLQKQ